ncbi:Fur family transcriptional regulator [Actinophytocola algeriensis]|uniref:Fur family ferric uptake transcriptional regulator n=1 Tax=Actinophytocola algeriensis TaxID=1768010 RepID=A0A7W7Q5L6_9PSEU|nr:Fur family transcriptional regulator [Actinophytocola algeriensis]MBB4907129.1 Fur family ferric uptake transcriptional regulator [Actinophytocola algeriensis]MBE1478612.1 Fur family ferric uptake transcriptional regulator [Actinophytocola algeriensis]
MNDSRAEQLRAVGLRVTAPRVATLDWLAAHPHATADQVAKGVRARLGSVSTQAIYDVLNACTQTGLLRRIEPAGSPARFETRVRDDHHHIVCRVCGRTEDVDHVVGEAPCVGPTASAGFVIDEAEVVFWGVCPDCRPGNHTGPRSE